MFGELQHSEQGAVVFIQAGTKENHKHRVVNISAAILTEHLPITRQKCTG
jgi:hypothetical protein